MPNADLQGAPACKVHCIHPEVVARARAHLEEEETYIHLAELFGALADTTRAKIVHALLRQELCTCDLAAAIGVTESGVSQHLRVLRSLRLVKSRRKGKFVYYSLEDTHVSQLFQVGLAHQGHEAPAGAVAPLTLLPNERRV